MDSMSTFIGGGDGGQTKTPKTDFEERERKILCIFQAENMVGAATFDPPIGTFGVFNQIPDHPPNFPLVACLLNQERPGMVVLSRRVDKKLAKVVVESVASYELDATSSSSATTKLESSIVNKSAGDGKATTESSSKIVSFSETYTSSSQESAFFKKPVDRERLKRAAPQPFVQKVHDLINVVTIPHENFVMDNALEIKAREIAVEAKKTAKISAVAGSIDLEETVTVRAIAGLLKFMGNQTVNVLPSCVDGKTQRNKIKTILLEDMVLFSGHSKNDLAIFRPIFKTFIYSKSASKSEGCSLLKLLEDQCPSSIGKKALREILDRPLRDVDILNYRLDFIQFFQDSTTEVLVNIISKVSSGIGNLDGTLTRMRFGLVTTKDWSSFKRSVECSLMVAHHILDNQHLKFPDVILKELASLKIQEMEHLVERFVNTVDFEATQVSGVFTVKPGVDTFLDEARAKADRIEDLCAQAREQELQYWAEKGVTNANIGVGFWPGVGFMMELLVVGNDFLKASITIAQDEGCEVARHTSAAVFYRTPVTNYLNEQFGDPRTFINDRQCEIEIKLRNLVIDVADDIQSLIKLCAQIQCFIAFANSAKFLGWTRPAFNKEGRISIKNGRHPLQEQFVLKFFPNSYSNQPTKVQVITGPNTSGKSVFMKQVAMIVYLAQIGSFVPAEFADICPVDKILTCIKSEDSVASQVSYFMSALNQISTITREATKDSLVIIDEFGKGTHPLHGTSLLAALINSFVKDTKKTPNVLVATHLRGAISFVKPNPSVDFFMFSAEQIQGEYVNQFQLIKGKSESSLAFEIARSAGIDAEIVSRSRDISQTLMARQALVPKQFQEKRTSSFKETWDDFLKVNLQSKKEFDGFLNKVIQKAEEENQNK